MKKLIDFNENTLGQIQDIKEVRGVKADVEIVRMCISETHARLFPAYTQVRKNAPLSTEDKAKQKVDLAEAQKKYKEDKELEVAMEAIKHLNAGIQNNGKEYVLYEYRIDKDTGALNKSKFLSGPITWIMDGVTMEQREKQVYGSKMKEIKEILASQ